MTDLDIEIKQALTSDSVSQYVEVLNYNSNAFKDEIEKLVNNLKINTSTLEIGTTDTPLNKVVTKNLALSTGGFSLTNADSDVKASLSFNGDGDSVLVADIIEVGSLITSLGFEVDDLEVKNSLLIDSAASTTINGPISISRSVTVSYEWFKNSASWLGLTWNSTESRAEADLTLYSSTKQNNYIVLNAENDTDVYDSTSSPGWKLTGASDEVWVYLDLDSSNPPASGQTFNISLRDIVDNLGNSVFSSATPSGSDNLIKIAPGDNLGESPATSLEFTDGAVSVQISNEGVFRSDLTVQYIYDDVNDKHLLHIVNAKNCTVNYS